MATIKFIGNSDGVTGLETTPIDQSTSGIGFFGGAYGLSVPVGSYQDSTFVTNGDGDAPEEQTITLQNTKYSSISGVKYNTLNAQDNNTIPNWYAPLNIRFEHTEAVRVKNCQLRIFNRSDITQHAEEVETQVYEVRHPESTVGVNKTLDFRGSSNHEWTSFLSAGPGDTVSPMDLTDSPGMSGFNGNDTDEDNANLAAVSASTPYTFQGAAHESLQHDWYVALSASPTAIGSKTNFGLYFTLEYL